MVHPIPQRSLCYITLFYEIISGLSDVPGESMVKSYCPKCQDVYTPKSSRHHHTDGAYFGSGFPHMLFMVHPEYRPKRPANQFSPRYAVFLFDKVLVLLLSFCWLQGDLRKSELQTEIDRIFLGLRLYRAPVLVGHFLTVSPHEATYSATQPKH